MFKKPIISSVQRKYNFLAFPSITSLILIQEILVIHREIDTREGYKAEKCLVK